MTPQQHEFYVLEGIEPTISQHWDEFLIRFRQSAKSVGFSNQKALGLAAALGEMADNTALHSGTQVPALVGYAVGDGTAVCSICDVGVGVLNSLRESEDYQHLHTSVQAIRAALHDGVTRLGLGNGGNGFRSVFKALIATWGTLRFRSGEGCVSMDGTDPDSDRGEEAFVLDRQGFQITICCRMSERQPIPLV